MSNYNDLKTRIAAAIHANGVEEITGDILQSVLIDMVDAIGDEFSLAGVATTTTVPGTPDNKTAYIATSAGTYTNFLDSNNNPIVVPSNALSALLTYDPTAGHWTGTTFGTLAPGIIGTNELADGAVTTPKIANVAVTTPKIANAAVTNPKINNGAVSEEKLATAVQNKINNAVTLSTPQTITGAKEFTQTIEATGGVYADGDLDLGATDNVRIRANNGTMELSADDDMNISAHHLDINNPTGIDGSLSVVGDINATGDVDASGDIKANGKVYANINDELATKDHTDTQLATKQDTIADLAAIRAGAALGATAYQLPTGGVPTADIADGSVTTPKLADEAVTLPKIAPSAIDSKPTAYSPNLVSSDGVQGVTLPLQSDINHIVGADITKTIPVTASTEHSSLLDVLEVAIKNGSTFSVMYTNGTGTVTNANLFGYNDTVGGLPARSQYGNITPNTWHTFTATNNITRLGLYWSSAKATQSGNISLRVVITGSIAALATDVTKLQTTKVPFPISFTGGNNTFKWGYSTIAALAGHTYRIVPVVKDWEHTSVTSTSGNAFAAGYRVGSTDTLSVFVSVADWAFRDYYDLAIPNNVTNGTIVIGGRANNGVAVEFGVYDITDAAEAIDNIQIYREGYIDTGGATTTVLKYFYLAEGCTYRFTIANFAKSPLDNLMKFAIGYYPDKNNLNPSTFVTIEQVNTTSGSDVDLTGREWFISVPRGGVGRISVKGTTGQHVPYYIENVSYVECPTGTQRNYGGERIHVHGVDGNKYYENIIPVSGISSYNGKSLQGMAIYKGYAVITYDTGFVRILRLSDYTIVASYAMPAGVQQANNHAGQANFSTQFYADGDDFPLLYVSSYLENKCYVLRVTMTGCTLIQEITCANAWHFHPDNDGNLIVHFNDWSTYRLFDLPDISNASVTLNVADATDSFSLVTPGMYTAGGFCQDGKFYVVAYYTTSRPEGVYDRLIVYDYIAKDLAAEIIFENPAIRMHEFEGIAPTGDNSIMVSFVYNQLAELHFD